MKIWRVDVATLADPQPTYEPQQLDDVLNRVERDGWTVFTVVVVPHTSTSYNRARVISFKESEPEGLSQGVS